MIDKNYRRVNKCLAINEPDLSEELDKLGYLRKTPRKANGIIVYPKTNEYEELPYSEIEFKEGWNDWYDEADAFLRDASEEYYDPKFRPGLPRFSIVSPYWTDVYYSEDPEDWEEDLREHKNPEWMEDSSIYDIMMNTNEEYGGFGFECNSIEEIEILSKYFWKHGFTCQLRDVESPFSSNRQESRVWFTQSPEGPVPEVPELYYYKDDMNLYLCNIKYSDYSKLREAILGLWKIGFVMKYTNGYYY